MQNKGTNMNQTIAVILIAGLFGTVNAQAEAPKKAKSPVTVTTQSYQQMPKRNKKGKIVKDKKGKPILVWVKATKVVPGTVVRYVDTVSNHTDKAMEGLAIKNPINPHLIYVAGSATSETNATITYSVDGGKHFDVPEKLYVTGLNKKKHRAQPKEYNAIQWTIASVPAQSETTVAFKAKLK